LRELFAIFEGSSYGALSQYRDWISSVKDVAKYVVIMPAAQSLLEMNYALNKLSPSTLSEIGFKNG